MTDTEAKELKELITKRSSVKGRITTFEKFLIDLKKLERVSKCQINELKVRLKKLEELFSDYDLIQTSIEIKDSSAQGEREGTEDRFFQALAEAQEFIENYERGYAESECSKSINLNNSIVKLPTIKLPIFDGDMNKWLEFRDTYTTMIHNNESLPEIAKYQYLKGSLTGTAAGVIDSLELTSKNYDIAWKLVMDRFNNKQQLVYTHLKALFEIPAINKECAKSIRLLVDHICKNLRALNSLDEKTDNWDTLIIFMFTSKLDSVTSSKWEEHKNSMPTNAKLEDFYEFLRKRAGVLELISPGSSDKSSKQLPHSQQNYKRLDKQQKSFVAASCEGKDTLTCSVCGGEHLIYYCEQFLNMTPANRLDLIIKKRSCINCLRSGHFAHQCKSSPCKICKRKHNSLVHVHKDKEDVKQTKTLSVSTCVANEVLLSTAVITVSANNSNKSCEARCLLDSGSQASFISKRICNILKIQGQIVNSVCVTGVNNTSFEALHRCTVNVQSRLNAFSTKVNALIIDEITNELPTCEVDISNLKIPDNLILADPNFNCPAKVDLLLGADVFWDLISSGQIKLGLNKPILQNSILGWLVTGPAMCNNYLEIEKKLVCNFSREIQRQLNKFWELEEVSAKPMMSAEEEACEQHFVQHTRRLADGRFCVTLPLKIESQQLGDSYYLAKKRLDSLEKRFNRQPDIKSHYLNFIREYESLGHLSRVERPNNAVFLPHHPVMKEHSESTQCRVVFDASAKTSTGLSLNDIMMVGPTVQDDIFSILTRLRQHKYIVTGDLEKMYRQILVEPSQRHLQMILWRENQHEPLNYLQLNTVTYGTSCAPFLSTRCLVQLARECDEALIKAVMLHDFYIDDFISGQSSETDLLYMYQRVAQQLKSAGFNLRKVRTNSQILLNEISNQKLNHCQEKLKFSSSTSTLGIEWDPNTDCILIPVSKSNIYKNFSKFTKRIVLSISSSIFDPLGILSVCIITCKMILQLLWLENLGWDDEIPLNIKEMWLRFISNLTCIENLLIPRNVMCANPVIIDLHIFSDASLKAYAACVYVRTADALGNVTVRLLCAKARVKPLKTITIPRLELCGAVLAARLYNKVNEALRCTITQVHFWCDSKVVLGWLKMPSHKLNAFVSHRAAEVNNLCSNSEWMYVPSLLNPADLASRGVFPDEVQSLSLWWEGPSFLKDTRDQWPDQHHDTQIALPELRVHVCNVDLPQITIIDFNKYSSFLKLRRIFAYVCRFVNNCRCESKIFETLTVDELEFAECKLAYLSQKESFSKYKNNFKGFPKIYNLTPSVDTLGLIRVGGRIENSDFNFDKRHPILLDGKHQFSKLVVHYFHIKFMHAGPQLLLSLVREQYWLIGGRRLVKQICNSCILCRRMKGVVAKQIMGNLPAHRINPGFPFEIAGTDYAGPFLIVNKRGRGASLVKCYLCVFVCFKVKAVHLELVTDLSTEAFILALRRFISRRGKPREIYCDNGTNFVGASRAIFNLASVSDLVNEGIKFRHSPAYSPHFGGLYESAVKSAKFHMKRVIGNTHLTYEELSTLFIQIEAILNSRPITPLSSDPNDLSPLTPGHFLVGRPLTSLPSPDLQEVNPNRLHRFARIEQARQHFWSRWSREYICELQQRTKWQLRQPDIKPDQLVLIRDDSTPPMKWPLGRVTAVYPGSDGACRVADIKTSKGVVRRAINKICPLLDTEDRAEAATNSSLA